MNSGSAGDDKKKGRATDSDQASERVRKTAASDMKPKSTVPLVAEGTAGEAVVAGGSSPEDAWAPRPETETPETPETINAVDDARADEPQAVHAQPRKSGGGGWLWVLVALALIGIGAYATKGMWYDQVAGSLPFADRSASQAPAKVTTAPSTAGGTATTAPAPTTGDTAKPPAGGDVAQTPQAPMVSATTAVPTPAETASSPPEGDRAEAPADGEAAPAPITGGTSPQAAAADTAAMDERLSGIAGQLAKVETRLSDLETRLSESAGDELAGLQQRIDRLEARVQPIAPLETRLNALEGAEQKTQSQVGRETALVLAVGQLRQALTSSGAYGDQLNALRAVVADDAELQPLLESLQRRASDGVPTEDALSTRFPAVARDVIRAEQGMSGDGWVARMTNRLTSLVTVRRTGEAAVAAGGSDAVLAEAQAALDAGNLSGAVAAVDQLQGSGAAAAKPWLDDAKARLDVEAALASLQSTALARLATERG